MNNLKNIKTNFDFKINKCTFCNNTRVIDTNKGKFIVKKNNNNNNELFRYLETKNFNNFLSLYDYSNEYEIYPYVEEVDINFEEKAQEIVYLISILHTKTTFYKNKDLDKFKELYEDINNKLLYINNYYENIRMINEDEMFMPPSGYLFLRNSSVIFKCIDLSKNYIDKWYETIKNKNNYRVATIHNYLELNHLLKGNNSYLISWDKSCKASPVYDILSLFKNVYDKTDFSILFEVYNSKYPLYEEELYLLFSLMLVPDKLEFNEREIINTKNVYELTNYLITAFNFVSKYNSNESDSKTN